MNPQNFPPAGVKKAGSFAHTMADILDCAGMVAFFAASGALAEGIISTAHAIGASTAGTGAMSGLMAAVGALSPVTWAVVGVSAVVGVACYFGSNYVKQQIADQDDLAQKAENNAGRERALQNGLATRGQQQQRDYDPVMSDILPDNKQSLRANMMR